MTGGAFFCILKKQKNYNKRWLFFFLAEIICEQLWEGFCFHLYFKKMNKREIFCYTDYTYSVNTITFFYWNKWCKIVAIGEDERTIDTQPNVMAHISQVIEMKTSYFGLLSCFYLLFLIWLSPCDRPFSEVIRLLCWLTHHVSLQFCSFCHSYRHVLDSRSFCLVLFLNLVSSMHITNPLDRDGICPVWHLFCMCDVFFFSV